MVGLIAVLAFASVTLLVWGIARPRENTAARRMRGERFVAQTSGGGGEESFVQRIIRPAARGVGRQLASVLPGHLSESLDRMLMQANSRRSVAEFVLLWAVFAV